MRSMEKMKYLDQRRALRRKRKRSEKSAKKEVRKARRKKRRKKIKLAFKKLGEGALKVIKSPVFKSTIGLLGDKALDALSTALPELAPLAIPLKTAVAQGVEALDHIGDKKAMESKLKAAANTAKGAAMTLGSKEVSKKIEKLDNPMLKEALKKSLDYANKAAKASSLKEVGQKVKKEL